MRLTIEEAMALTIEQNALIAKYPDIDIRGLCDAFQLYRSDYYAKRKAAAK
jgi:hypothetical protein